MTLKYLPGWFLLLLIGLLSGYLSKLIEIGGKHPIEAAVFAILIGVLIANSGFLIEVCKPGVKAFEKLLIAGIVFMGATLNFTQLLEHGFGIVVTVIGTMTLGLVSIYWLATRFKLSSALGTLLSVGTCICGGTAIAIMAPLIGAKEEETSYAIGTIALWGLLAIFIYPKCAMLLGINDISFGIFAGTAIHSTPQVVGAGFIFSETAGNTAIAVKLLRNCFLAPVAFIVPAWYLRNSKFLGEVEKASIWKAFPWFLFGFFFMAALQTQGVFSPELTKTLGSIGKFLILLGMAGVGLNTKLSAFKSIGLTPLVVGLLGSMLVAGASATFIWLL